MPVGVFKVTDYIEPDLAWEREECLKLGLKFAAYQLKDAPPAVLVEAVADADLVLVNMARISAEVIAGLPAAQVILRHGIGYDNVDVEAATEAGIIFANQPRASTEDVAEHAVMLLLETAKKRKVQDLVLRDWIATRRWSADRIAPLFRLQGKTLGVVGCGNIGSRVVKKMEAFDVQILVCDPYLTPEKLARVGLPHTPLEELVRRSDLISLHLPVTEETRHLFNRGLFRLMKPTAVVVNTSRGPIIDTRDLIEALRAGVIAGAGLDVFEEEPPPAELPLLAMDNAVLTPHIAWYSEEGGQDIRRMIMEDVRRYLEGEPPRHIVNKAVLGRPNLRFRRSRLRP